jgi:opacity protein-like surface antigen
MFKKTALVAGIGLALSVTAQADYRWELGGDYTYGEFETTIKNNTTPGANRSNNIDENVGRLFGTWYMENVDTSKGPLAEAAFLDHASDITVAASDGQIDFSQATLQNRQLDDQDGQSYSIDMRYVAEGPGWKLSGWIAELGYEYQEPGDRNIDLYNIGIGKYLTPNTTLVVSYNSANISNGGDTDGYDATLEHFFTFSNGGLKVDASAGKVVIGGADDVDLYSVGGTWYLNNNIGFGAGYDNVSRNGNEINGFNVGADWFITESFAMDLTYRQLNFDDIDLPANQGGGKVEVENDSVNLGARFRF